MELPKPGERIVDATLHGLRCRAAHKDRRSAESTKMATEGTILYGLVRQRDELFSIHWDNGTDSVVPSCEIVLTDPALTWQ